MVLFAGARLFRRVVLVADILSEDLGPEQIESRTDLEKIDAQTLQELISAINAIGYDVLHLASPSALARAAPDCRGDLVLSVFGGSGSRSRMALIPAVCEAFALSYVGPDAYGRIIAQDKEVSKRLALDCGMATPSWRVIRREADLPRAAGLPMPVVIKPILEGSSIGITARNLQGTPEGAADVAKLLLRQFAQPVLIESFVAGREVSYSKVEHATPEAFAFSEMFVDREPAFFETRLFDAEEKFKRTPGRTVRNIDAELNPTDKQALDTLLSAFGRYGYCRIDGRFRDGRFHFIELTPDAWLGRCGQFAMGFAEKGWAYNDLLSAIIASAAPSLRDR